VRNRDGAEEACSFNDVLVAIYDLIFPWTHGHTPLFYVGLALLQFIKAVSIAGGAVLLVCWRSCTPRLDLDNNAHRGLEQAEVGERDALAPHAEKVGIHHLCAWASGLANSMLGRRAHAKSMHPIGNVIALARLITPHHASRTSTSTQLCWRHAHKSPDATHNNVAWLICTRSVRLGHDVGGRGLGSLRTRCETDRLAQP
jgi:hypothetical protein